MTDQDDTLPPPPPPPPAPPPPAAAPPTTQGDFVAVKPPESWPTVIGVLSVIFGGLGTLSNACGAVSLVAFSAIGGLVPKEGAEEFEAQMANSMPYPVPQGAHILAEFGVSIVLLVGGIVLLMRRPAASRVLVAFGWLDLLSNTYAAVLGYFVLQAQAQAMQDNPQMASVPPGLQGMMMAAGPIAIVIGWVLTAIWPVFLIWWFRRAKTRASIAAWR